MRFIHADRWKWALGAYVAGGLTAALLMPPLTRLGRAVGLPAPSGTVVAVNVLLPAWIIAAAVWYPRARLAICGAPLAFVGFTVGATLLRDYHVWRWTPRLLATVAHPIVLAACLCGSILAAGAAMAVRPWRCVGLPDAHLRCPTCGYLLIGIASPRCPECGRELSIPPQAAPPPL